MTKKSTISKKIEKINELGSWTPIFLDPTHCSLVHAQATHIRTLLACSHYYQTCQQNAKFKRKENQSEVEIKASNFYIYAYEPSQKLAYIKDEAETPQLPKLDHLHVTTYWPKGVIEAMKFCILNYWLKLQRF